jgi:hypothetical protein
MAVEFNVDAALAKLEALATTYGPKAVDLGAEVAKVDAINNLLQGAAQIALACGVGFLAAKLSGPVRAEISKSDTLDQDPLIMVFGGMATAILTIVAIVLFASGSFDVVNVWNWVGITQPNWPWRTTSS